MVAVLRRSKFCLFPGIIHGGEEREKRFSRSSASAYYTERKLKNKNGGGLGTRLSISSNFLVADY